MNDKQGICYFLVRTVFCPKVKSHSLMYVVVIELFCIYLKKKHILKMLMNKNKKTINSG